MFPMQDQFSAAAKSNFATSFALYNSLTSKTLESVEKLINLNITAVKASMEESTAATKQILAAKDPQEFLSLVSAQSKPSLEKAIAYSSHVANIASSAQAEFSKAAETQFAEASRKFSELIEEASKNAPAGSETFVNLLKTTLGNATNGYEQFTKTAKQAVDTIEANINAATGAASSAAAAASTANATTATASKIIVKA